MAFFGINYSKPGPGVGKDEPEMTAFFRFFSVYSRKFWDIAKINMLYFISIVIFFIPIIFYVIALVNDKNLSSDLNSIFTYIYMLICALPLALTGPFTSGFSYFMRNVVREEHSFLWSDYKDNVKNNFKQSVIATLINIVIVVVLIFNIHFYYVHSITNQILFIPFVLSNIAMILLVFMHFYIYMLIVTFDLKLKQIYKNALLFSILGLGRNILVTILILAISVLNYLFLFLLLLVPFTALGLVGFIISFSAWPLIKKFMIDANPELNKEKHEMDNGAVFKDFGKEK